MFYLIITLLVIVLLLVFYQDYKRRTIHVILPILIFSINIVINYLFLDISVIDVVYNIVFIAINIIGLVLYFSIKSKQLVNPIDSSIGIGDIVFLVAITPLFNLKSFVLFFILGLMFSLIVHFIYSVFKKTKNIPLAGYLSIFLILYLFVKNIIKINIAI